MSEINERKFDQHKNRRSIVFPMLLILLGLFFLLSNMNLIPGDAKTIVFRFWPLLFVLGGLEDLVNRNWVGAVMNVGIGGILILANLGYFPWTAWEMIWRIWPVAIIAIGLNIAFRGQSLLGSLIGVTISILIVGGLLWFGLNSSIVGTGTTESITYDLNGAKEAQIVLNPAIANLQISAASQPDLLFTGEISLAKEEELVKDYEIETDTRYLKMRSEGTVIFPSRAGGSGFPWKIQLNDTIQIDLTVDQGVGEQVLDFTGINLKKFDINLGVGSLELTLPTEEIYSGSVECAIGELIVRVPMDVPIKINLDTAITARDYPDKFTLEGDWLYSPGAKDNSDVRILYLSNPIGSIKIVAQ